MEAILEAGEVRLTIELNTTPAATKIWEVLPLEAEARTWGQEVYFTVPVDYEPEELQELVEKGDVAYWPPGRALCLFFGPTPVSRPGEIRPYSPVAVVGKVRDEVERLASVRPGDRVRLARASGGTSAEKA